MLISILMSVIYNHRRIHLPCYSSYPAFEHIKMTDAQVYAQANYPSRDTSFFRSINAHEIEKKNNILRISFRGYESWWRWKNTWGIISVAHNVSCCLGNWTFLPKGRSRPRHGGMGGFIREIVRSLPMWIAAPARHLPPLFLIFYTPCSILRYNSMIK